MKHCFCESSSNPRKRIKDHARPFHVSVENIVNKFTGKPSNPGDPPMERAHLVAHKGRIGKSSFPDLILRIGLEKVELFHQVCPAITGDFTNWLYAYA